MAEKSDFSSVEVAALNIAWQVVTQYASPQKSEKIIEERTAHLVKTYGEIMEAVKRHHPQGGAGAW